MVGHERTLSQEEVAEVVTRVLEARPTGLPEDLVARSDTNFGPQTQRGVNLRDVGNVGTVMLNGRLFRSSELLGSQDMQELGVRTILDLRGLHKRCMRLQRKPGLSLRSLQTFPTHIARHIEQRWLRQPLSKLKERALRQPVECVICSGNFMLQKGVDVSVYHADLLPACVKLRLFWWMPRYIKWATVMAPLRGCSPESVMAPAVADTRILGYTRLYRLLLDRAKGQIARALRLFVDAANYPILVHCIHGKDRTGLIIMLLLLICGADPETIIMDYVQSEVALRDSRERKVLRMHDYLVTDDVIASKAETMADTLQHLQDKYGTVQEYSRRLGLTDSDLSAIRLNLLRQARHSDLLERMLADKVGEGGDGDNASDSGREGSPPPGRRREEQQLLQRHSKRR